MGRALYSSKLILYAGFESFSLVYTNKVVPSKATHSRFECSMNKVFSFLTSKPHLTAEYRMAEADIDIISKQSSDLPDEWSESESILFLFDASKQKKQYHIHKCQ